MCGSLLRRRDLGEPLLFPRKRRLLLLTLGRFARLAGGEIGPRRSDRALPVGATRCKRLRVGQARPAMGEKIRLACRFGLVPVGGGRDYAIEQQQRVAVLGQKIGERRPAAQQRFMRHFERRRARRRRAVRLTHELCDQQPALGQRAGEREEVGR
jgi:hypothetical protein